MFDPDTDEDFYQEHTDVACPECDHVEAVVPDVLGFYSRRRPHNVTWSFWCDECGHEWTVNEDLRPEAPSED